MRGFNAVVTVAVLALPTTLAAQEPPPIERGERVRVTAPDCGMRGLKTSVQALRGDTLVLDTTECPLASVIGLDVSRGRKSHLLTGAGIGLLVGAGAGVLIVATAGDLNNCDPFTPTQCALILGGIPAGSGLLLGSVLGLLIKTDRWEEVPLDRLRVSFTPQRDGFSVRLSLPLHL